MLLATFLVLALLTVPLAGGRLTRLADMRLERVWAIFASLALQILIVSIVPGGSERLHEVAHLFSYALAGYFLFANRKIPFLWLIALGGLTNLTAIVANGGVMPASRDALETAGLLTDVQQFTNSGVVADPNLLFIGDVFAVPAGSPLANVFSIGDVCMALGVFLLIHAVAASRLALGRTPQLGAES